MHDIELMKHVFHTDKQGRYVFPVEKRCMISILPSMFSTLINRVDTFFQSKSGARYRAYQACFPLTAFVRRSSIVNNGLVEQKERFSLLSGFVFGHGDHVHCIQIIAKTKASVLKHKWPSKLFGWKSMTFLSKQ